MTIRASISIPIETKKRLLKLSRNGSTSAMAWWLYSDSEITNPATNAPSASDRPASDVSHAIPRQRTMIVSRNSSRLRLRTICSSRRGTTYQAPNTSTATSATDFPSVNSTLGCTLSEGWASNGSRSIIGTTARS